MILSQVRITWERNTYFQNSEETCRHKFSTTRTKSILIFSDKADAFLQPTKKGYPSIFSGPRPSKPCHGPTRYVAGWGQMKGSWPKPATSDFWVSWKVKHFTLSEQYYYLWHATRVLRLWYCAKLCLYSAFFSAVGSYRLRLYQSRLQFTQDSPKLQTEFNPILRRSRFWMGCSNNDTQALKKYCGDTYLF